MKTAGRVSAWSVLAAVMIVMICSESRAMGPTHKDIRYSKRYERSVLDFWQPKASRPTPMIVYFHGGGFKAGDKSHFHKNRMLSEYHSKGIAFASVNYPFLGDAGYMGIMKHTVEAIRFLKSKAKEWNIDEKRIAVMGCSAGAMISEYVCYWAREGIAACFADQQPYGSSFLLSRIRRKGPPLVLYTSSGPSDKVHHPDNAKQFKKHCDKMRIECEMYGTKASGLPELPKGISIEQKVMKVFCKAWQIPLPE